jgi:hypothetical protein
VCRLPRCGLQAWRFAIRSTITGAALGILGRLALRLGYVGGRLQHLWAPARQFCSLRRRWRTLRVGELALRVPPGWGDIEADVDGGYVLHNRPRRLRLEGDAVWYASAIELRILAPAAKTVPANPAMTRISRQLAAAGGSLLLLLMIANGVGPKQRRIARKVLASARVLPNRASISRAPPPLSERTLSGRQRLLFHPRISGPPPPSTS